MSTALPEMLEHLDAAIQNARVERIRSRKAAMTIVSPTRELLGCVGIRVRNVDDDRYVVAFTLRQVKAMRKTLLAALAEEAKKAEATGL